MQLTRAVGPALLTAALVAAGTMPAAADDAASAPPQGDPQPVSVIELTTDDGDLTELADSGLASLEQAQPHARSMSTAAATTQAAPSTSGVAVLTEPLATDAFYVAGVTWQGTDAMPDDAVISLRVMENGQWQEWDQLEVEQPSDDPNGIGGTEPYIAAGAEAVQVQIAADADQLPPGIKLSLTPEWPAEEEQTIDQADPAPVQPTSDPVAPLPAAQLLWQQPADPQPQTLAQDTTAASAAADSQQFGVLSSRTAPRPSIVSRAGWGASASLMRWSPRYVNLRASVVHHTAGTNNYTQAQAPSIVRGIYHFHSVTRGWGDIGYNFLIDKWGRIYEGRYGSLTAAAGKMPVGAHAAPFNTGTVGLSVMGDYTKASVPQAAMNSMASILAWQFSRAGIDPTSRSGLISNGTPTRPKGQNLPRVFGHKDVSNTACPGAIYSRLGSLAQDAKNRINNSTSTPKPTPKPTPAPPMIDDLKHTSRVFLNNGWGPYSTLDYVMGNRNVEYYVGDWDGDGKDTLALRRGNKFYVYNANATGAKVWIAHYGKPTDEVLVGDWDGDGKDSFAVRRGNTFHVKNRITSGDADQVIHYGRRGDQVLVGDWNGDRRDTFAVRRGKEYHVKNSIAGGNADHVIMYGRKGDTVLVGDWNGDRKDTFAVRRGFTYHVKNTMAGGDADIVLNYGRANDVILVGDWDGNRTDTLGVVRH